MRKPNIHGGGSKTNTNGLKFEGRTDFIESLRDDSNFSLNKIDSFKKTFQVLYKNKNYLSTPISHRQEISLIGNTSI